MGDYLIRAYQHFGHLPRQAEAFNLLRKIASSVKPLMRQHNLTIGILCEMDPSEEGELLGLNEGYGQRVLLRLRHRENILEFLPFASIIDTMLHELCHNVIGPHGAAFDCLWNQLRLEYAQTLQNGCGQACHPCLAMPVAPHIGIGAPGAIQVGPWVGVETPPAIGLTLEDFIATTVENSMAVVSGCVGGYPEANMVAHNGLPYNFGTAGDMSSMSQMTSMPSFMGNHPQAGQSNFGAFARTSSTRGWPDTPFAAAQHANSPPFMHHQPPNRGVPVGAESRASANTWQCRACASVNPNIFPSCERCRSKRDRGGGTMQTPF